MTLPTKAQLFASEGPWLFGKRLDLMAFGGSAALGFAFVALGWWLDLLDNDVPAWAFLMCVVAGDIAHVWSTLFRVYFDGAEVRRRPVLYLGLPILVYGALVMLHAFGSDVFWRVLAYFAVFHFVRQQIGWMRLYGSRDKTAGSFERRFDVTLVYVITLYPILWWHGHLPRTFDWFIAGDFLSGEDALLPFIAAGETVFWTMLCLFGLRQLWRWKQGIAQPGKALLVTTTAASWYVGIVAMNSDFAFTMTNIFVHAIPYFLITYLYGRVRSNHGAPLLSRLLPVPQSNALAGRAILTFFAIVLFIALCEEYLWDHYVWHDLESVFGEGPELGAFWLMVVVPLLALPQVTHYALDGFIWRRESAFTQADGSPLSPSD